MNANALMKANILALLRARGLHQKDIAQVCRKTEGWFSHIIKNPTRKFPIAYYDRIADLLGVDVFQLFVPGIGDGAERRSGLDRRNGRERRKPKDHDRSRHA